MFVTPLEPEGIDGADLAACRRVLCANLAYDLPGDPLPATEDVAAMLGPRWPGEHAGFWLAWEHGEIVGLARLYLPERDGRNVGALHVDVHPAYRRRGAGTRLLAEAVRRLLVENRRGVYTMIAEGTDGARFAHARGLRTVRHEARAVLDAASLDQRRLDELADEEHAPYRLAAWVDAAPDDLLPLFGAAKRSMRGDTGGGVIDVESREWDSALVREHERAAHARGVEQRVVVAVHEPTGDVVGLTEIGISRWTPRRAMQDDTSVLPAHRGHGLGLWMKAEMLRWLRAERPDVVELVTWNAEDNTPMRHINDRLGYKLDRWWSHCHGDVHALCRRLDVVA